MGDISKKIAEQEFLLKAYRQVPSQLPFNVTRTSYDYMLGHCVTINELWACRKNGSRVHAKVNYRSVYDKETGTLQNTRIPVAVLFCSGCDKPPDIVPDSAIWASDIETVSM